VGVPYDVQEIEARWRARWERDDVTRVDLDAGDPSDIFYNLVEFPYPSAEGLHVGHVYKYSGADAFGRYQRMRGKRVFQPMGFDAFGINAENYALAQGVHPADLIGRTSERFRAQLSRGGMAWDWSRAVDTSKPEYYRWTQWLLVTLFNAGLMYQAEDGQWFLRITAYADRLVDGLDALDWPERAKRLQRAWIGRSDDGGYRLHDWLISRQRYWGPPIPIVHCPTCGPVAVPVEQLPVELPYVEDFHPTGRGVSPLADIETWVATTCPTCGAAGARRETDVSDTFVDSSWYFLRYPSTDFDDRPWDDERTRRVLPVDFYAGGPEHVQRHHLYARFVTMALYDLGLVPFEEPFPTVRLGGFIVLDGAKMSKSRGNVITPDKFVEEHGSDVLRCALLFSAPWERGGDFQLNSVAGIERFFSRVWRHVTAPDEDGVEDLDLDPGVVAAVTHAVEGMRFNVGLARVMESVRSLRTKRAKRTFVKLLAPFAPHLAEELWANLGGPYSVHVQPWPDAVG
jgi:leucyl-tRNA synthetase